MNDTAARLFRRMARPATTEVSARGTTEGIEQSEFATTPIESSHVSKTDNVLGLLRRPEGATLNQLMASTGWLAHSTRAALTGLRKKGHVLLSEKPLEGPRTYRIAEPDLRDAADTCK